jgi:hypothetical protein
VASLDVRTPSQREIYKADRTMAIDLRCPYCKHQGAFAVLPAMGDSAVFWQMSTPSYGDLHGIEIHYTLRQCPRRECRGIVFCVGAEELGRLLYSYPPETVDWDASNLPERVLDTFEEAITAEANQCYRASALMTRRTLELVCADQGATGANLLERVKNLGKQVVLPQALLDALDQLRLLGNDAAHVDAKTYAKVGQDEARVALDVAKELLKSVYQLNDLLSRLQALQRAQEDGDEGGSAETAV